MAVFTSSKPFSNCTRAQLLDLAYILEEQRDKALADVERLRAQVARVEALLVDAEKRAEESLGCTFDGTPFSGIILPFELRAALAEPEGDTAS